MGNRDAIYIIRRDHFIDRFYKKWRFHFLYNKKSFNFCEEKDVKWS